MFDTTGSTESSGGGHPRPGPGLRDRRGRGPRGPDFRLGPLAPDGVPAHRSRSERFDTLALAVLDDIESRWVDRLPPLDLAVEDVPALPETWSSDRVPLGSLTAATPTARARIVLFRRPIEHRAEDRAELAAIVLAVLVDQVADILGVEPGDVHPDYPEPD